jgi:hypothetical protein
MQVVHYTTIIRAATEKGLATVSVKLESKDLVQAMKAYHLALEKNRSDY